MDAVSHRIGALTHSIDPTFRLRKRAALRARRIAGLQRLGALAVLAALGIGAWFWLTGQNPFERYDLDQDLAVSEDTSQIAADAPVFVPAIVDLAGDPMWIVARTGERGARTRSVPRPDVLADVVPAVELTVLEEPLLSASEQFIAAIPSAQEDFAFFQAGQANFAAWSEAPVAAAPPDGASRPSAPSDGEDATDGWDQLSGTDERIVPEFRPTEIENNISVGLIIPEADRAHATEDAFMKVLAARALGSVLAEAGVPASEAATADEAWRRLFGKGDLDAGSVVALRLAGRDPAVVASLVQVSVYADRNFLGALARDSQGGFVVGADAWGSDDLIDFGARPAGDAPKRQYRLLDAIYSAAARNDVPTAVIGEAIMYLSRAHDLDVFATDRDRLALVYAPVGRGDDGAAGRVLYAGIHGGDQPIQCFVYRQEDGQYACVPGDDQVRSLQVANGMVTPVAGVLTSTFGPRRHPILKIVQLHKGVDWAAPVGTPIHAAFDGEIVFQGDGGGYGNLVRIAHDDGRETRYAHMQRFAPENGVGARIRAGDVIGYVGTTGRSTGPHLHFELYRGGEAVDPLGAALAVASSDHAAVDTLTDRIIHVESGGNIRAKNPLSSATGLGQFIESTWIRMMGTYRPDLARSLSRSELLALRFDPTISREMVRNLALEGEAYLRARGHAITAGRLYLCHFLGMEGAHTVLSAPGAALLADVLGTGVINANPFLRGRNVNYVVGWAEAKMRRRGTSAAVPAIETREIRQTSPEFEAYRNAVSALLQSEPGADPL